MTDVLEVRKKEYHEAAAAFGKANTPIDPRVRDTWTTRFHNVLRLAVDYGRAKGREEWVKKELFDVSD